MQNAHEIKGIWNGVYRYDKPHLNTGEIVFEINIAAVQDLHFTGTVQDDVQTGGMAGKGSIAGKISNNVIQFKKRMPVHHMILPDGTRHTTNQKHPVIHYRGTYVAAAGEMTGTWKIKGRMFFYNRRLYISRKTTGTWSMTRATN